MKKLLRYFASYLVPKTLKNLYVMIKFGCVVHPEANLVFLKNIKIGKGAKLARCEIIAQGPVEIGANCVIHDHVILNSKTGYIRIGENTSINHNSVVFGNGGVEFGRNCAIGLNVQVVKNHLIPADWRLPYDVVSEKKTIVGDNVWLCSNIVIVDGVEIGSFSVVGSNSLVSQNIPEGVIAGGTPARTLRQRDVP